VTTDADREQEISRLTAIIEEHRQQMAASPEALSPVYADALMTLSALLAEGGRAEEALAAAIEGVGHFQQLANGDPANFIVHLGAAFNTLSNRLTELNRAADARRAGDQAVILSRLALEHQPQQARFILVSALMNQAGRSWRASEALVALGEMEEAVTVFADGGEAMASHLGTMIDALHRNALALAEAGRWSEAVAVRRMTARCFADPVPAPVNHLLALTLEHAAYAASAAGQPADAVPLVTEAVALARLLAQADGKYLLFLAQSLGNLACRQHEAGLDAEGLEVALEAINLLQQVAQTDASAAVEPLVVTLGTFAAILTSLGHADQAETILAQRAGLLETLEKAKDYARQHGEGEPR